ncbi:hypothetical protein [Variovorax sp. PAMC 28711]|uniref:hypothetical protein n=1 Tax=Variovorax sp. PAMC 28711 TaxID=1795631 RepID=UPI00078B6485|nr:hypothetical protein [Variovorax sp. PAMC 28711]AMM24595.1 hypothetical protein AX767_09725 [Variovorax sp. PAMC 28711]
MLNFSRVFPLVIVVVACSLTACHRDSDSAAVTRNGVTFPADADIASALQANFAQDPNSAKARELVQLLGGEKGQLDYKVRKVIYRQGAFETLYDVSLRMGQGGADSLQKLYATMIPKEEAAKLPEQTLAAYEKWLADSAAALEKTQPQQAVALRATIDNLGKCYRDAKANDSVALMDSLGALISPARDGWYADKLQSPQVQLRCLPL